MTSMLTIVVFIQFSVSSQTRFPQCVNSIWYSWLLATLWAAFFSESSGYRSHWLPLLFCYTLICSIVLEVLGPPESFRRGSQTLSLFYECLVPIWSHSVPLRPNFKSSVQISSYILILCIQLPYQNLYWMLNRHLEINTSVIRVLILSHQPASLSDLPIPKTSDSIFQVTQAKNLESSLILFPSA